MGELIKAFDAEGNEKQIDVDDIKWFGTEVERTFYKNTKFKSFNTHTWVKVGSVKLYPESWKISHLKKYFNRYDSSKQVIKEYKDGKEKRATQWSCEVQEEGVISLTKELFKVAQKCVSKKCMLPIHNKEFYYIFDNFFRDNTDTNNYYFLDEVKEKLVNTKYSVSDKITEKHLEEWRDHYEGH